MTAFWKKSCTEGRVTTSSSIGVSTPDACLTRYCCRVDERERPATGNRFVFVSCDSDRSSGEARDRTVDLAALLCVMKKSFEVISYAV